MAGFEPHTCFSTPIPPPLLFGCPHGSLHLFASMPTWYDHNHRCNGDAGWLAGAITNRRGSPKSCLRLSSLTSGWTTSYATLPSAPVEIPMPFVM